MAQQQLNTQMARMARLMVLNHPNSFSVVCFGKKITTDNGENQISGIEVLGLAGEDRPNVEFETQGQAKLLFVDPFQASSFISNSDLTDTEGVKVSALIEPEDEENIFKINKGDVLYIVLNGEIGLAYEIVGKETPIGVPSAMSATRYQLNKRDDLNYLENE